MTSTIIHVALLIWSGLFVVAGAMLMIASQVGHLADAVKAAADAPRRAGRSEVSGPSKQVSPSIATGTNPLVLPMPIRGGSRGPIRPRRAI